MVEDSRFPDTICEILKQAVTYKIQTSLCYTSASLVGIAMVRKMSQTLIVLHGEKQVSCTCCDVWQIVIDVTECDTLPRYICKTRLGKTKKRTTN